MKDFLERAVAVGDWIVYPNSRSPVIMNLAQVSDVQSDYIKVIRNSDGVTKKLRRLDRVVVVTEQLRNANI